VVCCHQHRCCTWCTIVIVANSVFRVGIWCARDPCLDAPPESIPSANAIGLQAWGLAPAVAGSWTDVAAA